MSFRLDYESIVVALHKSLNELNASASCHRRLSRLATAIRRLSRKEEREKSAEAVLREIADMDCETLSRTRRLVCLCGPCRARRWLEGQQ